jgi:hypothetical protein
LAQGQLNQLLAPIALYPDPLIAQILMASTYPLEVAEAGRWQQDPSNAGLQGDQLTYELEQQPWDPSVKSLVPFPQVLQTMNHNLEWTEQLGNAFLAQQGDVMNAVQHLRYQAERSGQLRSTPQQVVTTQGSYILIRPANPNVVYVPYYNPDVVYGSWAYPDYPPYYFSGYSYAVGAGLGFTTGIAIIAPFWGWHHWDWRDHRIDIDRARYAEINEGHTMPNGGYWQHDPDHRHGVPYGNPDVRAHFAQGGHEGTDHAEFRGYEPQHVGGPRSTVTPTPSPTFDHATPQVQAPHVEHEQFQHVQQQQRAQEVHAQPEVTHQEVPRPLEHVQPLPQIEHVQPAPQIEHAQPAPQMQQHAAPMVESFSRGQDVRQQQQRGEQSRAPAPQQPNRPAGGRPEGGQEHDHEGH